VIRKCYSLVLGFVVVHKFIRRILRRVRFWDLLTEFLGWVDSRALSSLFSPLSRYPGPWLKKFPLRLLFLEGREFVHYGSFPMDLRSARDGTWQTVNRCEYEGSLRQKSKSPQSQGPARKWTSSTSAARPDLNRVQDTEYECGNDHQQDLTDSMPPPSGSPIITIQLVRNWHITRVNSQCM